MRNISRIVVGATIAAAALAPAAAAHAQPIDRLTWTTLGQITNEQQAREIGQTGIREGFWKKYRLSYGGLSVGHDPQVRHQGDTVQLSYFEEQRECDDILAAGKQARIFNTDSTCQPGFWKGFYLFAA